MVSGWLGWIRFQLSDHTVDHLPPQYGMCAATAFSRIVVVHRRNKPFLYNYFVRRDGPDKSFLLLLFTGQRGFHRPTAYSVYKQNQLRSCPFSTRAKI
jgi:hypothetical protein